VGEITSGLAILRLSVQVICEPVGVSFPVCPLSRLPNASTDATRQLFLPVFGTRFTIVTACHSTEPAKEFMHDGAEVREQSTQAAAGNSPDAAM
jgi:hypothetical protein